MGSLTGVVASKSVTEASKGALRTIGNRPQSVMAKGRLTGRPTGRTGRKLEHSDPAVPYGRSVAQRIKGTPGKPQKNDGEYPWKQLDDVFHKK